MDHHHVLIAVDGSRNSMRAVEYAGEVFATHPEARLVLFHILPVISRVLLDKEEIKAVNARKVERPDLAGLYWRLEDEDKMSEFFAKAQDVLEKAGMKQEQIKSKFRVKTGEIPDAILEEIALGNYKTLILGRRGLSRVREFFLGSVSTKVVREARGCAVCVVE
ncbi:MAG: universal stress protein [Deltaproteobacteria bacterium]|nr:MAG: universal stress protein [Deltaproteobacteria bacterium]